MTDHRIDRRTLLRSGGALAALGAGGLPLAPRGAAAQAAGTPRRGGVLRVSISQRVNHLNPLRPYPVLQLDTKTMPILPHSLPVMGMLAFLPSLWRRVMDPKVAALRHSRD